MKFDGKFVVLFVCWKNCISPVFKLCSCFVEYMQHWSSSCRYGLFHCFVTVCIQLNNLQKNDLQTWTNRIFINVVCNRFCMYRVDHEKAITLYNKGLGSFTAMKVFLYTFSLFISDCMASFVMCGPLGSHLLTITWCKLYIWVKIALAFFTSLPYSECCSMLAYQIM